jgi:hypothetical protein
VLLRWPSAPLSIPRSVCFMRFPDFGDSTRGVRTSSLSVGLAQSRSLSFSSQVYSLGWVTSDLCGTSQSEEFRSPDGKQKIVVYAFDCGATTDFSLVVSLLGAHDRLPKHRMAPALYSHYHQEPSGSNIQVIWQDSHDAIVRVEAFDGTPLKKQDDVSVRFERLR